MQNREEPSNGGSCIDYPRFLSGGNVIINILFLVLVIGLASTVLPWEAIMVFSILGVISLLMDRVDPRQSNKWNKPKE